MSKAKKLETEKLVQEYLDAGGKITVLKPGAAEGYNTAWIKPTYNVENGKSTY